MDALFEMVWPFNEEPERLSSVLLFSFFMTIWWMLLFHFPKVKRLFRKKAVDDRVTI
jgi:hypothetical protein